MWHVAHWGLVGLTLSVGLGGRGGASAGGPFPSLIYNLLIPWIHWCVMSTRHSQVFYFSARFSKPLDMDEDEFKEFKRVKSGIKDLADKYIFQLEDTGNNLHYQIFIHSLVKKRPIEMGAALGRHLPGVVVSAASNKGKPAGWALSQRTFGAPPGCPFQIGCLLVRGVRWCARAVCVRSVRLFSIGKEALMKYCMKEQSRVMGPWADHEIYLGQDLLKIFGSLSNPNWYPWQKQVHDEIMLEDPDDRSINWVCDMAGHRGKSKFVKLMGYKFDVPFITYSDTKDAINLITKEPAKRGYLFDLSRTKPQLFSKDDLYATMESVKNGMLINTKFKTGRYYFNPPHVWVFSNEPPDMKKMSMDRWKLWLIGDDLKLHQVDKDGRPIVVTHHAGIVDVEAYEDQIMNEAFEEFEREQEQKHNLFVQ